MSKQPRDDANYPIPLLSYKLHGAQHLASSATPARSAQLALSVRVVSLYSTVDCFFDIGTDSVIANTSNSHFLPAGVYIDAALGSEISAADNPKYISVVSATDGVLHISERL